MKNSHLRNGPCQDSTPLKQGNMDIALSQHNQVHKGGEEPVLNVNVMILQSQSSVKVLNPMKLNEDEDSRQNLLTFKARSAPELPPQLTEEKVIIETEELEIPAQRNSDVSNIIEEETISSSNLQDGSCHSSLSDIFYSLDGINSDNQTETHPQYLIENSQPEEDQSANVKDIEMDYLTHSWKSKPSSQTL